MVPAGFASTGSLERLVTTLCAAHPLLRLADMLPKALVPNRIKRLLQRKVKGVPPGLVRSSLRLEVALASTRGGKTGAHQYGNYVERNQRFGRFVNKRGFGDSNTVYGYNAAALEIFQVAKSRGLKCVLDQTMAPFEFVESYLAEERERWNGWETESVPREAWEPLARRERDEWELADAIVCGSDFVKESLGECGGDVSKCHVVPDETPVPTGIETVYQGDRPLRVLFAGTVCLRKGIQYLWESLDGMQSQIDARAVGNIEVSSLAQELLGQRISLVGPVPRASMHQQYEWADCLVLPSLAEGSANVTYEALSHGVPAIVTSNAGSVVRDGNGGWVVPIRDSGVIRQRLTDFISEPALFSQLSFRPETTPEGARSYGERLTAVADSVLQEN
jgi:glycosyltransferase involved in cell wall biosynthesis